MKKILALGVGVVLAWAPAGPAFAAPQVQGTGNGKALGNCGYSSATGVHDPFTGSAGNGNGGHAKTPCLPAPPPPPVVEPPVTPQPPAEHPLVIA